MTYVFAGIVLCIILIYAVARARSMVTAILLVCLGVVAVCLAFPIVATPYTNV